MKGAALLSLSFLLCFSCTGGKGGRHVAAPDRGDGFPPVEADTLVLPSEADADTLPAQADELFDDFIFNYASNARLQLRRTVFPLPYYKEDEPLKIEKEDWAHDSLFVQQTYYTLLFDNEDDMDLVGDTTLKSVQVEWFFLDTREVKRYYFERKQGTWMLEAINLRRMEESGEEDFLAFYARFAADSLYQRGHLCDPLPYVTIDPDDEFSILETTLDVNQWF
ncbi:MAG: DUF4348 domain-containing protein, partial [Prevotellaceae bacterium]|nr:DUF4348 domain-containing protein [Prevotellaceae bacterium]